MRAFRNASKKCAGLPRCRKCRPSANSCHAAIQNSLAPLASEGCPSLCRLCSCTATANPDRPARESELGRNDSRPHGFLTLYTPSVQKLRRMVLCPTGCVLIKLRHAIEHCLAKGTADELQGQRQTAFAETRRNDQAGLASDVERHTGLAPIIGGERLVIVDTAGGVHARCGYRRVKVRKSCRYPVAKLEAPAYRLQVIDSAERRSGEEPLARPCTVILRPLLEPLLVYGVGFLGENDLAASAEILQSRQRDFADFCARFGEKLGRGVERFDLFGIAGDILGIEVPDDPDPQTSDILAQHRSVVGHRLVRAAGITWIMPGDYLKHQRVVAHRAGHWSDVVEREGKGCHT